MLITCEECDSRFQLDDSLMKEEGVKVKCSNCSKIFMAYPPSSIESSSENETGMQGLKEASEETEENGLDFSEMEAMLSTEDDMDIDSSSNEDLDITDSGFGFDETNELDLSDMDQIFEDDDVSEIGTFTGRDAEEIDLELDEVQDTVPSLGSITGESEEIEELDLLDVDDVVEEESTSAEEIEELDLELDEENESPISESEEGFDFSIDGETLGIEEDMASEPVGVVEELGMTEAEMEDMFSVDEKTDDEDLNKIEEDTALSFDLEKELTAGEVSDDIEEELGIDDMIPEDLAPEEPEEIQPEEDEDELEELGLTDLEEMFTLDEDQDVEEIAPEEASEFEVDEPLEFSGDSETIGTDATDMDNVQSEVMDGTEAEESEEDEDEFEEFGLTDLEEMFNLEAEQKPEEAETTVEDAIDYGDEDMIEGDSDELEFKLDEAIAVLDGSGEEEVGVEFEEYEELDLSELDEMFDKEESFEEKQDAKEEELGDLDFDMDALEKTAEDSVESSAEEDLGIADTSELDFSDIGEMLESDEEEEAVQELDLPDTSGIVEDESTLDFIPEDQPPVKEEAGIDIGTEAQTLVEDVFEEEGGLADVAEDDISADNLDLSDDDFDLSEMEKMLQEAEDLEEDVTADEPAPVESTPTELEPPPIPGMEEVEEKPIEAQEELDFGLDEEDTQENFFQTDEEETQDIELEFGVEEEKEEEEEPPPIKPSEVKEAEKTEEEDIEATYDMGLQLDELRKKQAAEKMKGIKAEEKAAPDKKAKPFKTSKPIPFEKKKKGSPVLVALLVIILVVITPFTLTKMGINIPYVSDFINSLDLEIPFADKIQQANIPYISDMVKKEDSDVRGINKITILEPSINGYYVENESVGAMFVISGRVRNDYDQLRSFISVEGQIYSKGKADVESKTIYAGNTLSEEELSTLMPDNIEKRLMNKFGDERSNFKLNKGKALPFMIVFTKVPDNLEGYDVGVAGSAPTQVKSMKK